MKIEKKWAMPNKRTFTILPIKKLIEEETIPGTWIEPFPFEYKQDALEYLKTVESMSVDGVLFDPPFSPRQLSECYRNIGRAVTTETTQSKFWSDVKKEIARVIKPGGKCISFSWNSNGLGKSLGFEQERILLVAHGGWHNDTIVVVERKLNASIPPSAKAEGIQEDGL